MIQSELIDRICSDIKDVKNINDLRVIGSTVKRAKEWIGVETASKLQIGDNVTVSNGKSVDEGVIKKINRTRAVVDMRGSSWTVPFSMITKEQTDE